MSELSRRDLLRNVALSATLGGLTAEAAQHVHTMADDDKAQTGGVYKPKAFTDHEWTTLRRLCELIFPADEKSKGALDAGAPEFLDLLASHNEEIASTYTGGIAWLDAYMRDHHGSDFVSAKPDQQIALLDLIAYRDSAESHPELGPGCPLLRLGPQDDVRRILHQQSRHRRSGIYGQQGDGAVPCSRRSH